MANGACADPATVQEAGVPGACSFETGIEAYDPRSADNVPCNVGEVLLLNGIGYGLAPRSPPQAPAMLDGQIVTTCVAVRFDSLVAGDRIRLRGRRANTVGNNGVCGYKCDPCTGQPLDGLWFRSNTMSFDDFKWFAALTIPVNGGSLDLDVTLDAPAHLIMLCRPDDPELTPPIAVDAITVCRSGCRP